MKKTCILLFLKWPEKGRVKTRLASHLNETQALELYTCFVTDILNCLKKQNHQIIVCYHPEDKSAEIAQWLGPNYCYWPQHGRDLGEKMANAFIRAFNKEKFCHAVLMGTDVPGLPCTFIEAAFDSLCTHSVSIGPSFDGGYYIIGFNAKKFSPRIFESIVWSTSAVFQNTLKNLEYMALNPYILPVWQDIDIYDDLINFIKTTPKQAAPATFACLSRFGLT